MSTRSNRNLAIKHAIENAGYTQRELAAMLGVDLSHLNRVVLGERVSAPLQKKIEKVLGCSFGDLTNSEVAA